MPAAAVLRNRERHLTDLLDRVRRYLKRVPIEIAAYKPRYEIFSVRGPGGREPSFREPSFGEPSFGQPASGSIPTRPNRKKPRTPEQWKARGLKAERLELRIEDALARIARQLRAPLTTTQSGLEPVRADPPSPRPRHVRIRVEIDTVLRLLGNPTRARLDKLETAGGPSRETMQRRILKNVPVGKRTVIKLRDGLRAMGRPVTPEDFPALDD